MGIVSHMRPYIPVTHFICRILNDQCGEEYEGKPKYPQCKSCMLYQSWKESGVSMEQYRERICLAASMFE